MENSINIIVYFNSHILNTNEGVTFVCERPVYFSILYTMSFAELENGLCQCINTDTPKIVEKILYRCPISIFGGFIQYQAIAISDDNSMQQMFRIHQQHQANIAYIELYVNFREVALARELESSTFPERDIQWEERNSESDEEELIDEYGSGDEGALDDVDDDANDEQVISQHPFGETSFMRALDLQAMHAPEFPEYANMGM